MVRSNPRIAAELRRQIERECATYKEYLAVLAEERRWFTKFNAEKINALQLKRQGLLEQMTKHNARRLAILQSIPNTADIRLSDVVNTMLHPADAKPLKPLVEELRKLISMVRDESSEFNQVTGFGLNIVNGLLSIFWSASQNIMKTYSPQGLPKESFNPTKSRLEGILKQA